MVNMNNVDLIITAIEVLLLEYLLFDRNRRYNNSSIIKISLYYIFMTTCIVIMTRLNVIVKSYNYSCSDSFYRFKSEPEVNKKRSIIRNYFFNCNYDM